VKQSEIPTSYEREMLKRRGLNPTDYTVEKRLNYALIFRNKHTGLLKFIDKRS
jgi:hypothetical protein